MSAPGSFSNHHATFSIKAKTRRKGRKEGRSSCHRRLNVDLDADRSSEWGNNYALDESKRTQQQSREPGGSDELAKSSLATDRYVVVLMSEHQLT